MMRYKKSGKEDAVSPVVGVMLMLVVTIIIAAVVSAFAGGLADSQDKPPQLNLEATYSQADGMTITHSGGDPVALANVEFMTTPSDLFGADAKKFAWIIDKSIINNTVSGDSIIDSDTGFYTTSALVAGDAVIIDQENCIDWFATAAERNYPDPGVNGGVRVYGGPSDYLDKLAYFGSYAFSNPDNIGKYFYLDLVDPSGSIITRTRVTITA